jgi:hypothetical protein
VDQAGESRHLLFPRGSSRRACQPRTTRCSNFPVVVMLEARPLSLLILLYGFLLLTYQLIVFQSYQWSSIGNRVCMFMFLPHGFFLTARYIKFIAFSLCVSFTFVMSLHLINKKNFPQIARHFSLHDQGYCHNMKKHAT